MIFFFFEFFLELFCNLFIKAAHSLYFARTFPIFSILSIFFTRFFTHLGSLKVKVLLSFIPLNRLDTGSMGVGSVDSTFAGNKFGLTAIMALAIKIAKEFDTDAHFEVVHANFRAFEMAIAVDFPIIDTQSWVLAKRRRKLDSFPMFGHLWYEIFATIVGCTLRDILLFSNKKKTNFQRLYYIL